jgi:hypothetical protein
MKPAVLLGIVLVLGLLTIVPGAQASCGPGDVGCCLVDETNPLLRARCASCVAIGGYWRDDNLCAIP